jgi:hypothetical protein
VKEDGLLFSWIRHYGVMIVLFIGLGVLGAGLVVTFSPRQNEAWSIVVGTGRQPTPRQVGAVAQAIFRSPAVYVPAMRSLGVRVPPQRFLAENVELMPVVQTSALIVVGRARRISDAEAFSQAMAISLVRVFQSSFTSSSFVLLGNAIPAPIRPGAPPPIALVVGGTAGLWLGVAAGVLHYRARRPVLSLARAAQWPGSGPPVVIDASVPEWLGVLRGTPRYKSSKRNRFVLKQSLTRDDKSRRFLFPGVGGIVTVARARQLASLLETFNRPIDLEQLDAADVVVVCHAGTPRDDFEIAWLSTDVECRQLVWVG